MNNLEVDNLEVIWLKLRPKRLPRRISCILLVCIYYTENTDYITIRDHMLTSIDSVIREHPDCGLVITCDFNQMSDNFLKIYYHLVQVVDIPTRGNAILDKLWSNMADVYCTPVTISALGASDHSMVLWKPHGKVSITDKGKVTYVVTRCMGPREKAEFRTELSLIRWEPLFRLTSCVNQYEYYHTIISTLMDKCFPSKTVTRHTSDKPWVTDGFRSLIRKRQRAHMSGDITQERRLRNCVNRAAVRLKFVFFQSKIAAINESGSRDWWKKIKLIMGLHRNTQPDMQSSANNIAEGDYDNLTNIMNDFFVSVSSHLPRIRNDDPVFARMDELPDQYIISVVTILDALTRVKVNKATGPDDIPAWVIRNNADVLAAPLTAIFNSSLREGILPPQWKSAYVVPVPKVHPPVSIEKDFRPISLTPIAAKVFESIVVKWVDDSLLSEIDDKQFGGITGTSTTDALMEMANMWYVQNYLSSSGTLCLELGLTGIETR